MAQVSLDLALESTNQEILSAVNAMASGTGSVIKSIQRGVITFGTSATTATATISAVDTSKALVLWGGSSGGSSSSNSSHWDARLDLSSSTVVTATKYSSGYTSYVSYQVVEFY